MNGGFELLRQEFHRARNVEEIVKGLSVLERERLTGWSGPPGAAYNVISEEFCERGLLNQNWSLSPLGVEVLELIKVQAVAAALHNADVLPMDYWESYELARVAVEAMP